MAQPVNGRGRLAYVAAAILVVGILVSATIILTSSGSAKTIARTSTTTVTSTSTGYVIADASGDAAFLADCASAQVNVHGFETLVAGTSSPVVICVQLYDFNSTSTILLNLPGLLNIQGPVLANGSFSESSGEGNFTVVASQDQLTLGGHSNTNEGIVVGYAVTAKPGASGTYAVGLTGWLVGDEGVAVLGTGCTAGLLVAGSGSPNYFSNWVGGCIDTTMTAPGSSNPGVSPVNSNMLFFRVIAVNNSTQ